MSQQKVDKYKKDKANRKKLIAKQKRQEFLSKLALGIVTIAFIGFIVVSAYFKWFDKEETTAEAATYSLSEEEISSIWEAYTEESESTEEETTKEQENTTAAEETTPEETTTADNSSEE